MCPVCRQRVAALTPAVEALALAVPGASPAPSLRQRVLDAVAAELGPARGVAARSAPIPLRGPMPGAPGRTWVLTRIWPRVATVAALALLVLSGWLGLRNAELDAEVRAARTDLRATRDELRRVQEYERAIVIMQQAVQDGGAMVRVDGTENAPGARGVVYAPPQGRQGVLAVSGLPHHAGEGYQLWLIRGDTRLNGGYFEPQPDGKCLVVVEAPMPLGEFDAFGITNEQRGGSPAPQGKRYMWGRGKGT
jgi:hypothetical protein